MQTIRLEAIPYQSFSVRLDNRLYAITLKACKGIMAMDLTRDNIRILSGQRLVAGFPFIPYPYLESGNFIILTANDELPYYTQFGVTQSLVYASAEELETLRNA